MSYQGGKANRQNMTVIYEWFFNQNIENDLEEKIKEFNSIEFQYVDLTIFLDHFQVFFIQ